MARGGSVHCAKSGKWPGVEVYTVPGMPLAFRWLICVYQKCVVHGSCLRILACFRKL